MLQLICDAHSLAPLFAVELDDRSHARADRVERDEFVNDVFEAAGLPLLHIPVRAAYDTGELAQLFAQTLSQRAGAIENSTIPAHLRAEEPPAASPPAASSAKAPLCPKCGVAMVLRTARTGELAGRAFYGCVNYPRCRATLPAEK